MFIEITSNNVSLRRTGQRHIECENHEIKKKSHFFKLPQNLWQDYAQKSFMGFLAILAHQVNYFFENLFPSTKNAKKGKKLQKTFVCIFMEAS